MFLLCAVVSAFPLAASAQTTQFKNDIFNKTWWTTQPAKFVNDIFNPTWWKTQPSKFVNDIFNPEWLSQKPAQFVNDIFNRYWPAIKQSKFFNDIFRQVSLDSVINTIKSSFGLSDQSAPVQSSSSGEDCWALYTGACQAQCGSTLDCLKSCSQKFSRCMQENQ